MQISEVTRLFRLIALLAVLAVVWGCGDGGGSAASDSTAKTNQVSVVRVGEGVYDIQGSNLDGIGGIDMVVSYDNTALASPTVAAGELIAGDLIMSNPQFSPNMIKIAVLSTAGISGSGRIVTISFARENGPGNVTVSSLRMLSTKGQVVSPTGPIPPAEPVVPPAGMPVTGQPASGTSAVPAAGNQDD